MAATFDPRSKRADSCFTICSTTNFSFFFFFFFYNLVLHLPEESFHRGKIRRQVNAKSLFDSTSPNFLPFHHSFSFPSSLPPSFEQTNEGRQSEGRVDLDCRSNFILVSCRLSPSERSASARSIGLVTRANQRRDNLNANVCEENVSRGNHILLEQRGKGRKGREEGFEVFDDGKIFIVCERGMVF